MKYLKLYITGSYVLIFCQSQRAYQLLDSIYGSMAVDDNQMHAFSLEYTVNADEKSQHYSISFPDQKPVSPIDTGDFLFQFEQHLVVALQLENPQNLFLHSAIIELDNHAIALIAPSGSGKSTTTWGLLHEGFGYLTDEMSAISLDNMQVAAFSHAISLKNEPPAPYHLPSGSVKTSRAYNIPVNQLPSALYDQDIHLSTILYVKYSPELAQPEIQAISSAESCSQLYTNSLNPLSHKNDGLDAAMQIAQNTQAFSLKTTDLQTSCRFIKAFLKQHYAATN